MESNAEFDYNWLSANCGLRVSKMCFGGATFSSGKNANLHTQTSEAESHALLDQYASLGGNFIDTANIYSCGDSEKYIGTWLSRQASRDRFVIATKLRGDTEGNFDDQKTFHPNRVGLNRQSIIHNLQVSLERLRTPYVDIYQIHGFDRGVPLEETLSTVDGLMKQGKIRYFGGSNLTGWQIQKYVEVAKRMGLMSKVVSLQQQYNLLNRESEWEAFQVCQNEGIGILPWSPLKGGLLSGKFKIGQELDLSTRVGWATINSKGSHPAPDFNQFKDDVTFWEIMNTVDDIAKTKGKTAAQVAIRWVLEQPSVSSVICGAHTSQQVEDNMAAVSGSWSLTEGEIERLNKVSSSKAPYPYDVDYMLNSRRKRKLVT